jgi:hypothetical protein
VYRLIQRALKQDGARLRSVRRSMGTDEGVGMVGKTNLGALNVGHTNKPKARSAKKAQK